MVGFSKKKINSYTLGEKLKRIREDMRISLAEIAKATKVKQSYLEKIETGCFDELPPDVYVKGFLKSYSSYLGVDENEVIEQYKKECGIKDNIKKSRVNAQSKRKFEFPSITITPR
ncbi:MAG: helix-turn-helix domain-containing protein, partial [Patescibacteria group bacterium]|nr:helix-turn-helix domain-containing protein [Patescibacteria group bacterium]